MSLEPGEVIDREVHPEIDQFFRVERGMIVIDAETDAGLKKILVKTGQAGVVPAGTYHTVYASDVLGAKLYTNYSPPNHPPNRVQPQKPKGGD